MLLVVCGAVRTCGGLRTAGNFSDVCLWSAELRLVEDFAGG